MSDQNEEKTEIEEQKAEEFSSDALDQVAGGVHTAERRLERAGNEHVALDDLGLRLNPVAQQLRPARETAQPPTGGLKPAHEPASDVARRTRQEDPSVRCGSTC